MPDLTRLVGPHLRASEEALARLRWQQANHDARRILRRTYARYPWSRGLFNIPTTPAQQFGNYVQTTLASAATFNATVLTLTSVAGLPTVGNFMLRIDDVAPATTFEYVEVSSVNVGLSQVTCARGQEGTTGIAHSAGAIVGNRITTAMLLRGFAWGIVGIVLSTTLSQAGITGGVDLTGMTVTFTAVAGRQYRVSWHTVCSSTVAGDQFQLTCFEGATQLGNTQLAITATGRSYSFYGFVVLQGVTAGSHTYKLQGGRTSGTGTGTFGGSATDPAMLVVEDAGPS